MSYFEPTIDADGVHIPTYNDIMEMLISKYKAIFGEDVYIGEETKDYQLLSIFAKCMDDYAALLIDAYNARNPNYASGDSLDLLLPLVSMSRRAATYSTVTLTLTGDAEAEIPAGKQALDSNGILWNIDSDVILNEDGEGTVTATCDVAGAISAGIGTIDQIYTPVIGWTGVTNEAAAIMGNNTETDDEVRARRKQMINLRNNGTLDAISRAILAITVDGDSVSSVSVLANDTGSTDANGIPAHSICCVVDGLSGSENAIGEAIWKAKSPGVGTYGGPAGATRISVNYVDKFGNTNVVNFARPVTSAVTAVVTIVAGPNYDSDRCVPIIKSALMGGIEALEIGESWGVTMAYRDIYNAFAGEQIPFVITSVTGKTSSMGSASTTEVPCAFNERLTISDANITITT